MKAERTYKELRGFDAFAGQYLIKNGYYDLEKKTLTNKEPTKLISNLKNLKKQVEKHFEVYSEERDLIQLNNCSVDEKTKVVLPRHPDGSRQYTVAGEKKLREDLKVLDNTKVEVHVRITEGEWDLTDEEKEAFSGLLIPEITKEEEAED